MNKDEWGIKEQIDYGLTKLVSSIAEVLASVLTDTRKYMSTFSVSTSGFAF